MAFAELRAEEFAALSARALGRLVADGRVSPVQLVELALTLAKATEPRINAYVSFLEPLARSVAEERGREARAGHLRSALQACPLRSRTISTSRASRSRAAPAPAPTTYLVRTRRWCSASSTRGRSSLARPPRPNSAGR